MMYHIILTPSLSDILVLFRARVEIDGVVVKSDPVKLKIV